MTQLERVEATRLRPGDVLYACGTACQILNAKARTDRVLLRTNTRRFTVPTKTCFRRVIRKKRIEMRPDLLRERVSVRAGQSPSGIADRIRKGYE